MKLTGSKTENEYREELVRSRQALFEDREFERLLTYLHQYYPDMKTAYIIGWTPEQGEDIYRILINMATIVAIEIDREESQRKPVIESYTLKEYLEGLSKTARLKIAVAVDLAETDINNID